MNCFKINSKTKSSKAINEDYHFFSEKENVKFGGIFDGHGGDSISKYFCKNIKEIMDKNPNVNIRKTLMELQKTCPISIEGTTALLYRITFTTETSGEIEIVWCGDSRGIVYSVDENDEYSVLFRTSDHSSSKRIERERHSLLCIEAGVRPVKFHFINNEDFYPINREEINFDIYNLERKKILLQENIDRIFKSGLPVYRMNGYLCPSRIFGHKTNLGNKFPDCCYIPESYILKFNNLNENNHIGGFFASDGVWDMMTSNNILNIIKKDNYEIDISSPKILGEAYQRWTEEYNHVLYKYKGYYFHYPNVEIGDSDDITFISFFA